jgi:hypothetical protein
MPFQGHLRLRVVVYSVFGVGAEIPPTFLSRAVRFQSPASSHENWGGSCAICRGGRGGKKEKEKGRKEKEKRGKGDQARESFRIHLGEAIEKGRTSEKRKTDGRESLITRHSTSLLVDPSCDTPYRRRSFKSRNDLCIVSFLDW